MKTPCKYLCPACGEKSGVNIMYGMPSHELWEAAERGEVAIGGAERQCLQCDHTWRIKHRCQFEEADA
jgi:hypothetical protein